MASEAPGRLWREIAAWVAVAMASVAAFWIGLYANLMLVLFSPYPRDLAESTAGFVMAVLVIVSGSLLAPRSTVLVAVVLSVVVYVNIGGVGLDRTGVVLGSLCSLAAMGWRSYAPQTGRTRAWATGLLVSALAVWTAMVFLRYVDRPERPDPMASELSGALGAAAVRVSAFYEYDLGGFIDRESLWRIDASPEVMAPLISALELQPTDAVPGRFWRMPPHYWPRSRPAGAVAFQSRAFTSEDRGPDGPHYFVLHDRGKGRVFVWFKNNF